MQRCVTEPHRLFLGYVIWYQPTTEAGNSSHWDDGVATPRQSAVPPRQEHTTVPDGDRRLVVLERRRQLAKQKREYAKMRDPLISFALQGLDRVALGTTSTVLLPSTSIEAESVVSLYLLGGGGARIQRPPGVEPREALGGVVVQRIVNQPLYKKYMSQGQGDCSGATRYREYVVWHGTRLKRVDGEGASLAAKLQSIAENGFDPQRCMKGAAAEGGIWVAASPLSSFGHGCDGLFGFVLCLAKTHFNEWVDSGSARVLSRERVLPLYSLVHA